MCPDRIFALLKMIVITVSPDISHGGAEHHTRLFFCFVHQESTKLYVYTQTHLHVSAGPPTHCASSTLLPKHSLLTATVSLSDAQSTRNSQTFHPLYHEAAQKWGKSSEFSCRITLRESHNRRREISFSDRSSRQMERRRRRKGMKGEKLRSGVRTIH